MKYNRDYFGETLPEDTCVYWEPATGNLGECFQLDNGEFAIRIDPTIRFSDRMARMTLIHEMVHVKLPRAGHGEKFQKEMHRLAEIKAFDDLW